MKKDLDRGVLIGIALVALLVMFNAAVSFRNTRRVRDDCQLITDTHERLAAIEALRVDRGELESSQRNFIISGDPAPLEAFQRTDGRMRSRFERLHELFADDSEQLARALALENSLTRAQNRLAATIEVRQKEGHEVAQRIVAAGESRRMLEAIDRDFDEISGTTKSLLARRRDATEQAYLTAVVFGGAAAFLGLVAVGMFVWLLRRHERSKSASAAAVYEQREWYRTTLGSIGDAVIATDAQGRVTFLNVVAEALTGWTVQDATGRPLDEVFRIVNETTRAPVENPAFRALHQGIVVGLANHTILIARDGAERPIDDSAAPIRDATGAIGGAVLVFRDVTERKRADDDFVRIAATLRLAVSAADLGAWDWDPVTDTVTLSGRAAEIYDAEPGRPLSREELRSRVHPEDRERVRRAAAKAAAQQEDYDNEYRLDRPDDQPVWLAVRGRGVYDEKGRMTRMLGVVQDVTARKRAESALRESEERQRKLADNLPSGFIYQVVHGADDLRRFNYVSAGVEALCGVTPAAVVADPMNLYGLIVPEDRERVARTEDEAIREARPFDCQLRVNVGGQERWLHCRSAPRFLPEGGAVWDGIAIEITAAKHAEEALRESDRRKDDFIALLAHELRNPLAPIRNGLQLIGLSSDREVLERARQMMGRQMTHLVRLVDDLLDVSRLGRGKMELRRSRVLLPDVIASAIETARPAIDAAAQKLEISLPAEPIGLDADLTRLAQVFSNLL
ncbi:MAG TPA: PAS domain S-box protein, partial [Planctomycetia bacterium]|nr:PAS domain S-box protein [Planctomycetia bacterium]